MGNAKLCTGNKGDEMRPKGGSTVGRISKDFAPRPKETIMNSYKERDGDLEDYADRKKEILIIQKWIRGYFARRFWVPLINIAKEKKKIQEL